MTCGRFRELMMAGLDGELSPADLEELREHLNECDSCRREFEELERVTRLIGRIELPKPAEEDMMRYWPSVYARIERGMGWGLLLIGAAIWVGYGVYAFITDPTTEALTKFLIALPIVGVLVLLVSVIRERYHVSKTERYKEVER
jgi:ferric-dicitrate binding protein FerR (iron transport regulator)